MATPEMATGVRKGAAPNQTVQPPPPSSDEIPPVESGLLSNVLEFDLGMPCGRSKRGRASI